MAKGDSDSTCFIIMPISTPEELVDRYKGDLDHFAHVLECFFTPALSDAGFKPIPPKSTGSDVIQAEIIGQLSSADLVLCDMSILNPNVFFEFGIRTALDKPVALVVDDKTAPIPFDTSIINFYRYDSSLAVWSLPDQIKKLAEHVRAAFDKSTTRNALWKYFGVAQTGEFKPEASTLEDKVDLMMQEVMSLRRQQERETSRLRHTFAPGLEPASLEMRERIRKMHLEDLTEQNRQFLPDRLIIERVQEVLEKFVQQKDLDDKK